MKRRRMVAVGDSAVGIVYRCRKLVKDFSKSTRVMCGRKMYAVELLHACSSTLVHQLRLKDQDGSRKDRERVIVLR